MPATIQHWNHMLERWEDCVDDSCVFDHADVEPYFVPFNPAAARSETCVWCGTPRRHHLTNCPVVTQKIGSEEE